LYSDGAATPARAATTDSDSASGPCSSTMAKATSTTPSVLSPALGTATDPNKATIHS
jgi:hypothetical protein